MASTNGRRYYLHFIDAYSKFTWIYLMQNKSQAFNCFMHFKTLVENQLGLKIKALQIDGGKEHVVFTKYLNSQGIIHHFSCPYTHEQNGMAKRKHSISLNLALHYWPMPQRHLNTGARLSKLQSRS